MVVGISELWEPVQLLRRGRWSLVNSGIQVDQVSAEFARRCEVDDHVALAIESAGVAHHGVVVGRDIYVVVFGPAYAF